MASKYSKYSLKLTAGVSTGSFPREFHIFGRELVHHHAAVRLARSFTSRGRAAPIALRVANDREGSDDEQLPQIAISLLGNAAKLLLAPAGILFGHKANPGGQVATSPEAL